METKNIDSGKLLKNGLYIGAGVLAFLALKKVAEMFGLIKTSDEKAIETGSEAAGQSTVEAQNNNPYLSFSPQYAAALIKAFLKAYPQKVWDNTKQSLFPSLKYKEYSDQLYKAKGFFKDDENSVLDIFRNLQTQFQVSQLSKFFSAYYKTDMLSYLKTFMNDDNLKDILDIIKNYPQFYK